MAHDAMMFQRTNERVRAILEAVGFEKNAQKAVSMAIDAKIDRISSLEAENKRLMKVIRKYEGICSESIDKMKQIDEQIGRLKELFHEHS